MSTLAVVESILRDAAVPLSVREIVERAGEQLPTRSKTPDTVVARDLSMDIKRKGDVSLFIRTSPGRYAIREQVMRQQQPGNTAPVHAPMTLAQPDVDPVLGAALSGDRAPTRPAASKAPSGSEEMSA